MPIHYQLHCRDPHSHLLTVEQHFHSSSNSAELWLPNWLPGSYLIRDFARHLVSISAEQQGRPCQIDKLAKHRWLIHCQPGPLQVRYEIYAFDESVRGAYLDQYRFFMNASAVLLAVRGHEQQAHHLQLTPFAEPSWQLATTLPRLNDEAEMRFIAADYATLIDHPLAAGDCQWLHFEVAGVPHTMALFGAPDFDSSRLAADLQRACTAVNQLFGGPLPFSRYLFMVQVEGDSYGGLEHRDSTALQCSRRDLPQASTTLDEQHYRNFLALCCHEYFHAWNIKRLAPKALLAPDLEQEVHSVQLWWYEGITSYYDELLLLRAGLLNNTQYLQMLSETLTRVYRHPGRFCQSAAASSFDAWTKLYKADENATNSQISYYSKGAMIGLWLDLRLRQHSNNSCSLDQLLRLLWQRYGLSGQGSSDESFFTLLAELSDPDLAAECQQLVYGHEDPPLQPLLAAAAVELQLRPALGSDDRGGSKEGKAPRYSLGASFKMSNGLLELTSVTNGGAAHQAGLSARDQLIAWQGLRASSSSWAELQHLPADTQVTLCYFRRDRLQHTQLPLLPPPADSCALRLTEQKAEFDWLGERFFTCSSSNHH